MKQFHVILKERKESGVVAQLKYSRAVVIEGPAENGAKYFELAKQWNAEGRTMTTEAELAKLKAEAFASTPLYQGELFGHQESPSPSSAGPQEQVATEHNEDQGNQPS